MSQESFDTKLTALFNAVKERDELYTYFQPEVGVTYRLTAERVIKRNNLDLSQVKVEWDVDGKSMSSWTRLESLVGLYFELSGEISPDNQRLSAATTVDKLKSGFSYKNVGKGLRLGKKVETEGRNTFKARSGAIYELVSCDKLHIA